MLPTAKQAARQATMQAARQTTNQVVKNQSKLSRIN
jgi:hypothetical protein